MNKTAEGCGFFCVDYIQNGKSWISDIGGTCANVLSILGFLGWESRAWVPLYEDEYLSSGLRTRGVFLQHYARTRKNLPMIIQVKDKMSDKHRFITRCPECGGRLTETCLPVKRHINTDKQPADLFFCDRISEGILKRAVDTSEFGGLTMYEPNGFRTYDQLLNNCRLFHVIKFSDEKVPENVQEHLLKDLKNTDVKLIIVTKGANGLKFAVRQDWIWIKIESPYHIEIADSSGAGDWLTAVFLDYFFPQIDGLKKEFDFDVVCSGLQHAMKAAMLSCKEIGAQGILHNRKCIAELETIVERPLPDMIAPCRTRGDVLCSHCGKEIVLL